jgi:hypothetical protein
MAHDYPLFDPDLFPEITALFQVTPMIFFSIDTDAHITEFAILEQLFVSDGPPTGP